MAIKYTSYPLGKIPEKFKRPELSKLKMLGYKFNDARDVVDIFEKKVAAFAGSKYAVSTDCCSHGIFLCLKHLQNINEISDTWPIEIPKNTYISVPMQIMHAGHPVEFVHKKWSGLYQLTPTRIYDSAVRWTQNMYIGDNALQVISFQIKKRIPIGRGGIILTNSVNDYLALKLISYDGRDLYLPYDHPEHVKTIGYHMYMTPEDAARGIMLMDTMPEQNEDSGNWQMYPDTEQMLKAIR
jgi:dTDP-4-amino-4,6-dideoxygalactose transaminase